MDYLNTNDNQKRYAEIRERYGNAARHRNTVIQMARDKVERAKEFLRIAENDLQEFTAQVWARGRWTQDDKDEKDRLCGVVSKRKQRLSQAQQEFQNVNVSPAEREEFARALKAYNH